MAKHKVSDLLNRIEDLECATERMRVSFNEESARLREDLMDALSRLLASKDETIAALKMALAAAEKTTEKREPDLDRVLNFNGHMFSARDVYAPGSKIYTIKNVRDRCGCGLREAKIFVDNSFPEFAIQAKTG